MVGAADIAHILFSAVAASLTYGAIVRDFMPPRRPYLGVLAVIIWIAIVLDRIAMINHGVP